MTTYRPKDEEEEGAPIIIRPKSAFRKALERGLETPAVWVAAMLAIVVLSLIFGR